MYTWNNGILHYCHKWNIQILWLVLETHDGYNTRDYEGGTIQMRYKDMVVMHYDENTGRD